MQAGKVEAHLKALRRRDRLAESRKAAHDLARKPMHDAKVIDPAVAALPTVHDKRKDITEE